MNEKKKQEIPIPFKLDDFYTTQEQRDEEGKEKVEGIDISLIDNFKEHPFKVIEDNDMEALKESIKANGLLSPVIIRKKDNGRYEMLSGHRRKFACENLGMSNIKCIIKDLSDDEATIFMVDSNLQREKLLPSEKAFAYKMKYDALIHKRSKCQLNTKVCQVGTVIRSDELLSEELGESARQIQRYMRLTHLIPELLKLVDNSEIKDKSIPSIALSPAVELSYLKESEQTMLNSYISCNLITPSHAQAIALKNLSQKGLLSDITLNNIMDKEKPNQIPQFKIKEEKLYKVIPKNLARDKIEDFVLKACEYYSKKLRQKDREGR